MQSNSIMVCVRYYILYPQPPKSFKRRVKLLNLSFFLPISFPFAAESRRNKQLCGKVDDYNNNNNNIP